MCLLSDDDHAEGEEDRREHEESPEIQSRGKTTARIVKGRSEAMARWGRYFEKYASSASTRVHRRVRDFPGRMPARGRGPILVILSTHAARRGV